ncbi:MAG: ABC transporter permease [Planctomycetota bacterium]|jgi:putative ABC transport system permease protein
MRAIWRLLLWELGSHWKQGLAIVVLLTCGIATLIMSMTTMRSLEASQDRYYTKYSFAHLWAPLVRAPEELLTRIQQIPGIQRASGRVEKHVLLDFPEMLQPASARLVSIEPEPHLEINGLYVRQGRLPVMAEQTEVVVSELFAEAHQLRLGDRIAANLEGKREELIVVGIGLSPDSIYVVQPGMLLPNNRLYGILWAPREKLAAAFNMEGAFNQVVIRLGHEANIENIKSQIDAILEPYGSIGAYDRDDQQSHARVRDEMRELRTMALLSPTIFLSVSAFLVHMVFSRMIVQQTQQIATLRAFGYSTTQIGLHYLRVVLVWVALGVVSGIGCGLWLASWLSEIYRMFFRFPEMVVVRFGWEWMLAVSLGVLVAFLGAISGVLRAIRLPPAVAMRSGSNPNAPDKGLTHIPIFGRLRPIGRMVMIRMLGNPWLTFFSILGMGLGVSLLILSSFMEKTIDYVLDHQFARSQRQDLQLSFYDPRSQECFYEVQQWPGVRRVETFRSVPIRIKSGSMSDRLAILGLEPQTQLFRVLDEHDRAIAFPEHSGLTITGKLAQKLNLHVGDKVQVDLLEGQNRSIELEVQRIYPNYTGPAAFLPKDYLHELMLEGPRISGMFLAIDPEHKQQVYRLIKETPAISGVTDKSAALANFREMISKSTGWMRLVNAIFATLITLGVAYNSALITFSERARDLATLRVLGYRQAEINRVMLLELFWTMVLAIPVGVPLGYLFAYGLVRALDSESHRFPFIADVHTILYAIWVMIASTVVCGWMVLRMTKRLDLISVLKVRE